MFAIYLPNHRDKNTPDGDSTIYKTTINVSVISTIPVLGLRDPWKLALQSGSAKFQCHQLSQSQGPQSIGHHSLILKYSSMLYTIIFLQTSIFY